MDVTVTYLDAINFTLSGVIEKQEIDEKVAQLEASPLCQTDEKTLAQETTQDRAEGELLKSFIDVGLKNGNVNVNALLGHPVIQKYERREDGGLYLELLLSLSPKVDTSIDYKALIPDFKEPKVTDEMVEERLKALSKQHAPYTPLLHPRALQEGDVAVVDLAGTIDGKVSEDASATDFNLKVGAKTFTQAFDKQIVGMQYAQKRTIIVTFPKSYPIEALSGKACSFDVTLKEIKEQRPLNIDDALAQKLLQKSDATLDELRASLKEQLKAERLSALYLEVLKPNITKAFTKTFEFILPQNLVEQEIDILVNAKLQEMDDADVKIYKEDKEKFHLLRDSVHTLAKERVKMSLIVEALAPLEDVEVSDEEMISTLYYQAAKTGEDPKELVEHYKQNNLMHAAKLKLTEEKLLSKLLGLEQKL